MEYEIIVVGGGHAGCEASLAAARKKHKTLLVTGNIKNIADMPCNPSIGGSAKGIVVREIDALGGEMGKNIDKTMIQIKMLNTSKGPAVHSLRAQADRKRYQKNGRGDRIPQAGRAQGSDRGSQRGESAGRSEREL